MFSKKNAKYKSSISSITKAYIKTLYKFPVREKKLWFESVLKVETNISGWLLL